VWVATGDGDCFSIGAGPWMHALRLNMDMVVLVFDNAIYGLTKKQTSPTTPTGTSTNTHPGGAPLPPLNPLTITLGVSNVSFVAQVVDWNPPLLYQTIKAAHQHRGTSFVRILQRCPVFSESFSKPLQDNPEKFVLLDHENGIPLDDSIKRVFSNTVAHDPRDWLGAMKLAKDDEQLPLGLLYHDPDAVVYEDIAARNIGKSDEEKMAAINAAMDAFAI
jgi:2-oxoglutarate/2-oxoacid ferredoxin oxidoreductase subunit beta